MARDKYTFKVRDNDALAAVNASCRQYDITDENGDPVLVEATVVVDGIPMRHRVVGKLNVGSIMRRAIEADDVYAELDLIIRDMRMVAQHRGVDEVQLGRLICAIIGQNATALLMPAAESL